MARLTQEGIKFEQSIRAKIVQRERRAALEVGATLGDNGQIRFRDIAQRDQWEHRVIELCAKGE